MFIARTQRSWMMLERATIWQRHPWTRSLGTFAGMLAYVSPPRPLRHQFHPNAITPLHASRCALRGAAGFWPVETMCPLNERRQRFFSGWCSECAFLFFDCRAIVRHVCVRDNQSARWPLQSPWRRQPRTTRTARKNFGAFACMNGIWNGHIVRVHFLQCLSESLR